MLRGSVKCSCIKLIAVIESTINSSVCIPESNVRLSVQQRKLGTNLVTQQDTEVQQQNYSRMAEKEESMY